MIVVKSRMQAASKAASSHQPQQYNGTMGAISRIMHVRPSRVLVASLSCTAHLGGQQAHTWAAILLVASFHVLPAWGGSKPTHGQLSA